MAEPAPPIRIMVANIPRILNDIIGATLSAQSDMEVIAEAVPLMELLEREMDSPPDVLVLGIGEGDPENTVMQLLMHHPTLQILGISGDGREGALHELRPHRVPLGELSPPQLVDVIRRAAAARRARLQPTFESRP